MAEIAELLPFLDDEEEEEEEAKEDEEQEDESLYWSSPLNPTVGFIVGCWSSSSDSEESAITASECCDYHIPLPHDLSDHTPPSPIFDCYPEALDARDFRLFDFSDESELEAIGNGLFVGSPESRDGDIRFVGSGSDLDSSEYDGVIAATDCDGVSVAPDRTPGLRFMGFRSDSELLERDVVIASTDRDTVSVAPDWAPSLRFVGFGSDSDSSEPDGVIPSTDLDIVSVAPDRAPGLRFVGFGSDSDSSEHDGVIAATDCDAVSAGPDRTPDGLGQHLSWGFIPVDEERRNSSEEFEWEEVDDRLDDRGVLSMMVGINDDETSSGRGEVIDVQFEPEEARGEVEEEDVIGTGSNIVWEVLLAMNNHAMARNNAGTTVEHIEDIPDLEDEVFLSPSDYDFQFGLLDHDNIIRGSPPAAKLVVDSLPSIILTEEDLANNTCLCAICKDEFALEEKTKQLPCFHLYHSDCILPWLGIRNTCPVCRYELPTDNPEYERLKAGI
ncbi:uncharacterized protein LOC110036621 [Phalaenopsis equestris]|uniref:uncharacterized protein LOC110036621 n=1 Tax=Phalaenopsis equestris TaxID=78828 RepID=UPI0009E51C1B|nr:uncharacterized protein LOC110036621 [Phalaenopsis equestris]